MNNNIIGAVSFAVGAATGFLVSWRVLKKRYADMANEEIQSVKDMYKVKINNDAERTREFDIPDVHEAVGAVKEKCEEIIERCNYKAYSDTNAEQKEGVEFYMNRDKPYTIDPEDFNMFDDYTLMYCDYFADGVVVDDSGNIVNDVEELIGEDNLLKFGEYEEDTIYVRNDQKKIDFEICRDLQPYISDESID